MFQKTLGRDLFFVLLRALPVADTCSLLEALLSSKTNYAPHISAWLLGRTWAIKDARAWFAWVFYHAVHQRRTVLTHWLTCHWPMDGLFACAHIRDVKSFLKEPLHWTISRKQYGVFKLLQTSHVAVRDALEWAAKYGRLNMVNALLPHSDRHSMRFALTWAILRGHARVLSALLSSRQFNSADWTHCVNIASMSDYHETTRVLLNDSRIAPWDIDFLLHEAMRHGNAQAIGQCIRHVRLPSDRIEHALDMYLGYIIDGNYTSAMHVLLYYPHYNFAKDADLMLRLSRRRKRVYMTTIIEQWYYRNGISIPYDETWIENVIVNLFSVGFIVMSVYFLFPTNY